MANNVYENQIIKDSAVYKWIWRFIDGREMWTTTLDDRTNNFYKLASADHSEC